jgi:ribulose-phosphate 3-epimerase
MKKIIPAIIAKDKKELETRFKKISFAKTIQLDIMDGKFVKNKSLLFDFKVLKNKKYEAHLMIENPKNWILKNYKKVNTIIFHYESCKNSNEINNLIKLIKLKKRKIGIAINPKTSVSKINSFIKLINMVLIMSVNPGKYGSKFIGQTLKKIKQLKKLYPKLKIEVDGGINNKTIKKIKKTNVDKFVVGSYLQKAENSKKIYDELRKN